MIPAFCINRPVATTLLAIGLVLAGLAGYRMLPVAALPKVDFPTINVSAALSGASPESMATSVATPLIKQFETIPGISEISSTNSLGNTSIVLQFDLNRDIDAAAADVQAAISHATRQLPSNMTTPPSYRKTNPADAPILLLAVNSDELPRSKVDEIAENVISPLLSTLSGVAEVSIYGSQTYAVRVELDPTQLQARNLGVDTVTSAIAGANSQTPVGSLQNASQRLTITADTQRTNADEFRSLVIATANGAPIHLGDVAKVKDSVANLDAGSWYDGKQAIILAVQRQPDANTVDVVNAIRAKLPALQQQLPPSVNVHVMNDASVAIKDAISDVQFTLFLTIGLVVLVIYLFTGHLMATLIPGLAVPLSLIATFGAMSVLGYSIDNISLLGLTLSVGLVVDDAIVMLENILRLHE
jgi:HAE1 family hydrophobic/amphiphilic exporter-1